MARQRFAIAHAARTVACAVACVFALACADDTRTPPTSGGPTFVLHADAEEPDFGAIDVINVEAATLEHLGTIPAQDPGWTAVLAVRTQGSDGQPVIGLYAVLDNGIRFVPRFRPVPGQAYDVRYSPPGSAAAALDTVMLVVRRDEGPATRVTAVYPAVDTVPMNLLRAYIQFSAPMSEGQAYDRIQLLDAAGATVADAFLTIEQELWDPDRTRFTLLFDPGRIKTGLSPNEELGLPLHEGSDYTLRIDHTWSDAQGRDLDADFEWFFHVGPADRVSPRVDDWSVDTPAAGSSSPVVVRTGESLDQAMLQRVVTIHHEAGGPVPGLTTVFEQGSRWSFEPDEPWTPGAYTIRVGTELEDLAGNNLRRLFDVDLADRQDTGVTGDMVRIPLIIR